MENALKNVQRYQITASLHLSLDQQQLRVIQSAEIGFAMH